MLHINEPDHIIMTQPRLLAFLSYMDWLFVCLFECFFCVCCGVCIHAFVSVNCCLFGEIKMNITSFLTIS